MFELLANLIEFQPWVGEVSAGTPVLMGIGALGAGLISGGLGLLGGLLSKSPRPSPAQSAAANAQAQALEQQTRLRAQLEAMIREMGAGGAPPVAHLNLREPMDFEQFLSGIAPRAELNALMQLLGGGSLGTGAIDSEARTAQAGQASRANTASNIAQNLLFALLSGGGGGGGSDPFNDPSTFGTGERLLDPN